MRYIIICKERGVFLGTHENLLFFSRVNDFGCYKVPSFVSREEAKSYSDKFMHSEGRTFEYIYPEFDTDEKYITCVEIIKKGYGQYTADMISNLPNYVDTMH